VVRRFAMDAILINQAIEELMSISGFKESREAAAKKSGSEEFVVAKEVYDFVANYPVDWSTTHLTNKLIDSVRVAAKNKYPFLADITVWRLGNHFAYLWK